MNVLITDYDFPDVEMELDLFHSVGLKASSAQCRTEDELIAAGKEADAFLLQYAPAAPAGRKVFEALPRLKLVSRYGAGFDTVNTGDAQACGVWVGNSPDYGIHEVASHALAMALNLTRHLSFYDRDVRAGKWHYLSPGVLQRPSKMTVGVLGLGRIGKRFAHLARETFGRVIACDPHLMPYDFPPYVERVAFDGLLAQSDLISLHTPLNDETRNILGAGAFAKMKQGAYLVNTARGGIVDVDAAHAALESGRLGGLALDVLPKEPPGIGHPLVRHPRTVLTPHAAFFSRDAEIELRRKAAQNIVSFAKTGKPDYVVVHGERTWQA
ncbi:MAG: C-terminal binding protein [Candidatus Protistobacter heckmanni]|nr:C-terminal binding protein [Candidatus Protistobacter heckmanni]